MVSVAKNFDAPIKLLFPKGTSSIEGKMEFSMLGLGDIVIPGIFVAIILRYDAFAKVRSAAHKLTDVRPKYFYSAMGGYAAGMVATIVVMNVFKAAQPALLYIVPGVLGSVGAHAAWNGELHELLAWKEHDEEEEEADEGDKKSKNKSPGKTPVKSSRGGDVDVNGAKRMTRSATKPSKKDS
jgi:minor histocompatibility antigen H13